MGPKTSSGGKVIAPGVRLKKSGRESRRGARRSQAFTQFTLLDEKAPDGYMWSGGRLTRKQLTSQARSFMARVMEVNGKECKAEGKAKVV